MVKRGQFLKAEKLYKEAAEVLAPCPPSQDLAFAQRGLARLLARRKLYKEAEGLYAKALATFEGLKTPRSNPVVQVGASLMAPQAIRTGSEGFVVLPHVAVCSPLEQPPWWPHGCLTFGRWAGRRLILAARS